VREFTTTGICNPDDNYMVDIRQRLEEIKAMIDAGQYFGGFGCLVGTGVGRGDQDSSGQRG
jgi:hypothetical protein